MTSILSTHVDRLRLILGRFPERRPLPAANAWKNYRDGDVWYRIVGQVATVGRADLVTRLFERRDLLRQLAYRRLSELPNDQEIQQAIWKPLREVGCRYVTADWSKCPKSKALRRNLKMLREFPGGPKGFLKAIVDIKGTDQSQRRIDFVSSRLHYIKNKGARDLLTTGCGPEPSPLKKHGAESGRGTGHAALWISTA